MGYNKALKPFGAFLFIICILLQLPMSIFNYKQRNNIVLVAIILLGCFLIYALSGLFSAILGAIVLFTIFRPVFVKLVEGRGWNKTLVTLLIIFTSLILIVIPFLTLSIM